MKASTERALFFKAFGPRRPKLPPAIRRSRPLDVSEREWRQLRACVFARDGYTCVYCTAQPPRCDLQADHVVARSIGGASTIDNLVTACGPCNLSKGARPLTEWRGLL